MEIARLQKIRLMRYSSLVEGMLNEPPVSDLSIPENALEDTLNSPPHYADGPALTDSFDLTLLSDPKSWIDHQEEISGLSQDPLIAKRLLVRYLHSKVYNLVCIPSLLTTRSLNDLQPEECLRYLALRWGWFSKLGEVKLSDRFEEAETVLKDVLPLHFAFFMKIFNHPSVEVLAFKEEHPGIWSELIERFSNEFRNRHPNILFHPETQTFIEAWKKNHFSSLYWHQQQPMWTPSQEKWLHRYLIQYQPPEIINSIYDSYLFVLGLNIENIWHPVIGAGFKVLEGFALLHMFLAMPTASFRTLWASKELLKEKMLDVVEHFIEKVDTKKKAALKLVVETKGKAAYELLTTLNDSSIPEEMIDPWIRESLQSQEPVTALHLLRWKGVKYGYSDRELLLVFSLAKGLKRWDLGWNALTLFRGRHPLPDGWESLWKSSQAVGKSIQVTQEDFLLIRKGFNHDELSLLDLLQVFGKSWVALDPNAGHDLAYAFPDPLSQIWRKGLSQRFASPLWQGSGTWFEIFMAVYDSFGIWVWSGDPDYLFRLLYDPAAAGNQGFSAWSKGLSLSQKNAWKGLQDRLKRFTSIQINELVEHYSIRLASLCCPKTELAVLGVKMSGNPQIRIHLESFMLSEEFVTYRDRKGIGAKIAIPKELEI